MASMPSMPKKPVIKMNTPAVNRLHVVGRLMDQLSKDLDRVQFLEGDIADKRKFQESTDLANKAKNGITKVRDSIAKNGGANVAKGYK